MMMQKIKNKMNKSSSYCLDKQKEIDQIIDHPTKLRDDGKLSNLLFTQDIDNTHTHAKP